MHTGPEQDGYGTWRPELTAKVRVLLHAKPLFDLRRSDNLRAPELRHYDTLALAIKVWDLVVDNMGLDTEVDRTSVLYYLEPLLIKMDNAVGMAPDRQRHKAIVEHVVGALSNEAERRRPFSEIYQDFNGNGSTVSRKLEYRLIWDYQHPAGGTVLRLSNEGINLYLRAWDLDIEDAQAAAEAVVLSQLNRGKFDEAVNSAKQARIQSVRYWEKITRIIRITRRDVHRVSWADEVPKMLNEAQQHIKTRTDVEACILQTARDRLDILDVEEGSSHAVAEVCDIVEDCRKRHFDLHGQLMSARNVFLDEQERQAFHSESSPDVPSLNSDVLEPLLRMSRIDAGTVLDDAAAPFVGAVPPEQLSLKSLIFWMLRPRRPASSDEVPVENRDLVSCGAELLRFPDETRHRGESILQDIETPTTLSRLLSSVSDWDGPIELQEYLVLASLQHFAPENDTEQSIRVQRVDGEQLNASAFCGDELILTPKRANNEHTGQ